MKAIAVDPEILLINRHYVRLFSVTGTPKGALLSNLSNGVAVDYDIMSQLVYWTDVTHTASSIGYTSLSKQNGTFKVYLHLSIHRALLEASKYEAVLLSVVIPLGTGRGG